MDSDLPASVMRFVRELERSGFAETTRQTGPTDSELRVFRRDPIELRLIKNRSQCSADLLADGWPERDRLSFPLFHGFALGD